MSITHDELRTSVARIMRGPSWTILILLILGIVLHAAGVIRLSPLAVVTGVLLLALTRWQARLVEGGDQPRAQFVPFNLVFVLGITVINYGLGSIRFPAATLFY